VNAGGTAFNGVVEELKKLTTRVAHVLPVSDDGGSTAEIVRVLGSLLYPNLFRLLGARSWLITCLPLSSDVCSLKILSEDRLSCRLVWCGIHHSRMWTGVRV
jgi:hypothetical protein